MQVACLLCHTLGYPGLLCHPPLMLHEATCTAPATSLLLISFCVFPVPCLGWVPLYSLSADLLSMCVH